MRSLSLRAGALTSAAVAILSLGCATSSTGSTVPVIQRSARAQHEAHLSAPQRTPDATLPQYVVIDLGTFGGTQGVAEGISDRGWVVGDANLPGDQSGHAFVWHDGVKIDLGTLGGSNSQEQWPVKDNRGLIVGSAETGANDPFDEDFCGFDANSGVPKTGLICTAFLWADGVMKALPTLGGNNDQALGVNNAGQIVGFAENSTQDPTCARPQVLGIQAVIWGPAIGEIHTLPPLPGDASAWATGVNDRGQIVGVSGNCVSPNFNGNGGVTPLHAVIWRNGTVTSLGSLSGTVSSFPWAINSTGQAAGQSVDAAGLLHTFLWQKGTMTDLGVIAGDVQSGAFGLNDRGDVVGGSCGPDVTTGFGCRAYLWRNGVMTDLNGLVKPGSTPLYLVFGNDINNRGEVAAYSFDTIDGSFHAAVAIPCDGAVARLTVCKAGSHYSTFGRRAARVAFPANVIRQFLRRMRFARFGAAVPKH